MHLGFAATDHMRWLQPWQILQPQACRFGFTVTKPPRLNDLLGGGNGSADNADRILDTPAVDRRSHQQPHEVERFCLLALLAMKVAAARYRQMRARRMGNHQIPAIAEHIFDWLLQVPLRITFAWQQIATKSKMPAMPKSITDTSAVFAGN